MSTDGRYSKRSLSEANLSLKNQINELSIAEISLKREFKPDILKRVKQLKEERPRYMGPSDI